MDQVAPSSAVIEDGKVLLKTGAGAECEINLFGATVTKFKTASGKDLIWLSSTAKLDGTKAIRGGIPLVFPQFGQPIKEMAQHGFARNNTWRVTECTSNNPGKGPSATLQLDNTMATHEAWPFPYVLTLRVKLDDEVLTTTYQVKNTGEEAFKFNSLQHTYLNVADITDTSVHGLEKERYLDKSYADPAAFHPETSNAIKIDSYTDRVYVCAGLENSEKTCRVKCPQGTIKVSCHASYCDASLCLTCLPCDVVMWNPWEEKAKGMNDFDDDGYLKMLCIEPGLVAGFHVLPAGGEMVVGQVLTLE